jgi:hypothetical protein
MIETHDAVVDADHVQSRFVVMVSVPVAPAKGTDCIEFATETWHLTSLGPVVEMDVEPHAAAKTASAAAVAAAARTDEHRG